MDVGEALEEADLWEGRGGAVMDTLAAEVRRLRTRDEARRRDVLAALGMDRLRDWDDVLNVVRCQRAENAELRDATVVVQCDDPEHAERDQLAAEVRRLRGELGLEMGMRTAAVDELESLRRALWSALGVDQFSDQDTLAELAAQVEAGAAVARLWNPLVRTLPRALVAALDELVRVYGEES
jgi:hypothetical protein